MFVYNKIEVRFFFSFLIVNLCMSSTAQRPDNYKKSEKIYGINNVNIVSILINLRTRGRMLNINIDDIQLNVYPRATRKPFSAHNLSSIFRYTDILVRN